MDVSLGSNPIFVGRSVHAAQEVLKRSVARRIGDDQDTNIWRDPGYYCIRIILTLLLNTPLARRNPLYPSS